MGKGTYFLYFVFFRIGQHEASSVYDFDSTFAFRVQYVVETCEGGTWGDRMFNAIPDRLRRTKKIRPLECLVTESWWDVESHHWWLAPLVGAPRLRGRSGEVNTRIDWWFFMKLGLCV